MCPCWTAELMGWDCTANCSLQASWRPAGSSPRQLTVGQVGGQVGGLHAARRGEQRQHEEDKQRLRQAAHRVDHKQVKVGAQLLPRLPASQGQQQRDQR